MDVTANQTEFELEKNPDKNKKQNLVSTHQ